MNTPGLNTTKTFSKISPILEYVAKQKENQKFIKSLELGGTLFLISFFIFFAIKPTVLTISALIGEIRSKELLSTELKSKINDVIVAQDLFSQVQEKYSLIESSLPSSPKFSQLVVQLNGASSEQQINLDTLSFSVDNRLFTTSISTASSFPAALGLVAQLSNNRRLMEISGVNLSIGKNSENKQINFNLPISIYYWPTNAKK
ncbi:hypothetical protein KBB48_02000 [Candidatus Shapirobacteria bacterium]|nr:hypothetical protein [Candidatus Shapirobacteria bacterium]